MTCEAARALLLEADVEALSGRGGSELARHVQACPRCAAAAAAILRANDALNDHLTAPVDPRALEDILERLTGPEPAPLRVAPDVPGRRVSRWPRPLWASLALAAAAAAVVFVTRAPGPAPRVASGVPAAEPPLPPLVEEAGGATVAVIPTDDPDITVIWFF